MNHTDFVFKNIFDGIYKIEQDKLGKYEDIPYISRECVVDDLNKYKTVVLDSGGREIISTLNNEPGDYEDNIIKDLQRSYF